MTLFRILGPLEVDVAGETVPLGGPKERAVLAHLILRANELVPAEILIDQLWPDEPEKATTGVGEARLGRRGEQSSIWTRCEHQRAGNPALVVDPTIAQHHEDRADRGQHPAHDTYESPKPSPVCPTPCGYGSPGLISPSP
jgi:hypothetical protein